MLPRDRSRPEDRRRSRRRGTIVPWSLITAAGVTIAVLALCFVYVVQSTALRNLTAQSAQAQRALDRELEINRILLSQIEEAFSWERVSRIAREQLGMIEPAVVRYVSIPAEDKAGLEPRDDAAE